MPIDGPGIQAKVNRGFAIAASRAGFPYMLYRPLDPLKPLRLVDHIATVKAAFDARPSYKFNIPALHKDAERYALVDNRLVQTGDYLISEKDTLFVASLPTFYGPVCVICNSVVTILRGKAPDGYGAIPDRTELSPNGETAIISGWPASVLFAGRGRGNVDGLPGDMPDPEYSVLLPAVPNIDPPRSGDVMKDERGRRFAVGWQETSPLGWRLIARLLTAG